MDHIKHNKTLRKSLSTKLLLARDFLSGKGMYVKHVGNQWHGIESQVSKYGDCYTMNVGFHYDFLPSLAYLDSRPVMEFGAGSFLLWSRTNGLRGREDIWSRYDVDVEQFRRELEFNIEESLAILDDCAVKWADPGWFLDHIPPHVLLEETLVPWKSARGSGMILRPAVWAVLPHWIPQEFKLCYFLCALSIRNGDLARAKEYVEIGLNSGAGKFSEGRLRELLERAMKGAITPH